MMIKSRVYSAMHVLVFQATAVGTDRASWSEVIHLTKSDYKLNETLEWIV
ncbi:MAG: hypothetical protein AB4040_07980 [Synechococcus sp.]